MTAADGERILRARLGNDAVIETVRYGETRRMNDANVSLHPAGHVLGSAQVRLEFQGEVWVASGDYKLAPDRPVLHSSPLRCHTFITESTFGLPIYRWPAEARVFNEINQWWRRNQETGKAASSSPIRWARRSAYSRESIRIGPIFAHGAVSNVNRCYRKAASRFPMPRPGQRTQRLRLEPGAHPCPTVGPWNALDPAVRRGIDGFRVGMDAHSRNAAQESIDRGFVLSDHADWPGLLEAIRLTEAESVWVTHGYRAPLVRWLTEQGKDAQVIETRWEDDELNWRRRSRRNRGMKAFADLYAELDSTTKTNEKIDALKRYFIAADPADVAWAVHFLIGRRPKRLIETRKLVEWAIEEAGIPEWLFGESLSARWATWPKPSRCCCHRPPRRPETRCAIGWKSACCRSSSGMTCGVGIAGECLARDERTSAVRLEQAHHRRVSRGSFAEPGGPRIGRGEQRRPRRALPPADGDWDPTADFARSILAKESDDADVSRPYPFCLAYPLEGEVESLGDIAIGRPNGNGTASARS